jgi:hypothetical protein
VVNDLETNSVNCSISLLLHLIVSFCFFWETIRSQFY